MWFRNLQLYRLTAPFTLDPEQLHNSIEAHAFRPCGALDMSSYGWVAPLGRRADTLTHAAGGRILLCARKEEKVLPAAVIREKLTERAAAIEEAEARPLGRKRRMELKDEITLELAPKAFTRSTLTFAYIDPQNGLIVVDAATAKKAEELLSLLRRDLGSLPAYPLSATHAPGTVMTHWLQGTLSATGFELMDECELREPGEEGGIVRCRRLELDSDEVRTHLDAGKQVTKLAVRWDERIRCVLDSDLSIKRLRFEDVVTEELDDLDSADEAALFDAQFALMTLELERFIPAVITAFGGEDTAAYGK